MNKLNNLFARPNSNREHAENKIKSSLVRLISAFIFLLCFSYNTIVAQCDFHDCDPALTSISIDQTCIFLNGTATISLDWEMQGDDPDCLAPAGSWRIQISLPLGGEYGVVNTTTTSGAEFTWTYDPSNATLNGISNTSIVDDASGTVTVEVTGFINTDCTNTSVNANLFIVPQFQNGCPAAFSNTTANDAMDDLLGVTEGGVVPVIMLSFDAYKKDRSAMLEWRTASEINSENFEILRSHDGRSYKSIGEIKAAGHAISVTNYKFEDTNPYSGTNFYKLSQRDIDGSLSISEVKLVSFDQEEISIHPNPVVDHAWLNLPSSWSEDNWTMEIFNSNLQLVKREVIGAGESTRKYLDMTSYETGLYVIRFTNGNIVINKDVINVE
jgi:hypothetical protein